jgi:SAM-dependent methyltransferase
MTMLFFELFSGLPRQGPGDTASTLKALALIPGVGPHTRVLDLGCGTGLQTLALIRHSPAHVTAIDNHPPFVAELSRHAEACGLGDRLDARVGDMRQLDFGQGAFDVIWCEGAIYVVGVETGLRTWHDVLVPGGHVAMTEVCWRKPNPPPECAAFWAQEYPAIGGVPAVLALIDRYGYDVVDHLALPSSCWWDDYYRPLQQNLTEFRNVHSNEPDALTLADQVQREIDIYHRYSEFYGYEFFVMRTRIPNP